MYISRSRTRPRAQLQLRNFIRELLTEGAETGRLRDDVPPGELASY